MDIERVFLIVLDSVGIGEMPDSDEYGDKGSNTLKACCDSGNLNVPTLKKLGLFNIDGIGCGEIEENPIACYAKMTEKSKGKDTTIGHWEISGIISEKPLPTYPTGFPQELIQKFEEATGRKVLCNKPYSGTKVLEDFGQEHIDTGALIVYTSADSVWQIAAHEDYVSVDELYHFCEIAREFLTGEHNVGRVIARPFVGEYPNFKRTSNRHDYSLKPPAKTFLDCLSKQYYDTIAVGKINDIFDGVGISEFKRTKNNSDGMNATMDFAKQEFQGVCFVNLVDFDMDFGHRNDVKGYTNALNIFDKELSELIEILNDNDVLMITADHGCDPSTKSTDHSREYTPLLIYGEKIKKGVNLGIRDSFADIGKSICDIFNVTAEIDGKSFANLVLKESM